MNQSNLGEACLVRSAARAGVAESLTGLEVLIEMWRETLQGLKVNLRPAIEKALNNHASF